jgi:hypothetical protein
MHHNNVFNVKVFYFESLQYMMTVCLVLLPFSEPTIRTSFLFEKYLRCGKYSTYREPGVAGTRSRGTVEQDHSDDPVSVAHTKPVIEG